MEDKYIRLTVADGSAMLVYTSFPASESAGPAIILLPEAFGVNHHICSIAEKFAGEGYTVISPELFHRTAPEYWEGNYEDFESFMPHYTAVTRKGLTDDVYTCYNWLTKRYNVDRNRIFSLGYSFGGMVSFLANTFLPLKAGASFYGGGTDQLTDLAKDLHGRHLFFWAGLDKRIKDENISPVINALDAAFKAYVNVKISYVDHGFNRDRFQNFNKAAADEAFSLTLNFFQHS